MKRILIPFALLALAAILTANAYGSSEQSSVRFAAGTFAINHTTCVFAHRETDYPLGRSWMEGRIYVAYEDERHDVLMGCNRARTTRIAVCLTTLPPVSEAAPDKQGFRDEKGLLALRNHIETCVAKAAL